MLEHKDAVKLGEFCRWGHVSFKTFSLQQMRAFAFFNCLCCTSGCLPHLNNNADWCIMCLAEHEICLLPSSALTASVFLTLFPVFLLLSLLEGPLLAMSCNCRCVEGVTQQEILFADILWGLWSLLAKASLGRWLLHYLTLNLQTILTLSILFWLEKL